MSVFQLWNVRPKKRADRERFEGYEDEEREEHDEGEKVVDADDQEQAHQRPETVSHDQHKGR